jgi:hypothetical protein
MIKIFHGGLGHSAVASQPCPYRGHLTGGYVASPMAMPKFAIANFTYPQYVK